MVKVLMFGWEFPPFKSGGLGTACYDLTKGLFRNGTDVTFVMPNVPKGSVADFVKLVGTDNLKGNIKFRKINTILTPYQSSSSYSEALSTYNISGTLGHKEVYGKNLYEEVYRYSLIASLIAEQEEFDIIHAHDWMTYQAGINARSVTGKPFVAHIHATEFDRTAGNPNSYISEIEYQGLVAADAIIANSNWTKKNVIDAYKINPDKIKVVHWGIDPENEHYNLETKSPFSKDEKIVLFLGRITVQKGPDYFVEMAAKVLKKAPKTRFVVAGSGDMFPQMVSRAKELKIIDKFLFTGFLSGADVHKVFQMADIYVMPSVSEPFGLVALEAMKNNTPVIISKQSGASEVITNALKVDFWDVDEMANKVVSVLKYPELLRELKTNSFRESKKFNLDEPARRVMDIYRDVLNHGGKK